MDGLVEIDRTARAPDESYWDEKVLLALELVWRRKKLGIESAAGFGVWWVWVWVWANIDGLKISTVVLRMREENCGCYCELN
jgi:hypothetical protein